MRGARVQRGYQRVVASEVGEGVGRVGQVAAKSLRSISGPEFRELYIRLANVRQQHRASQLSLCVAPD